MKFTQTYRVVVLCVSVLIISACSQGDGPETNVSAVVPFTQIPPTSASPATEVSSPGPSPENLTSSPTAVPLAAQHPTPSPTPEVELASMEIDDVEVNQCRITGQIGMIGNENYGTAPAPTTTPVPPQSSRSPELMQRELTDFNDEVSPIVTALIELDEAFQYAWPYARNAKEQAGQLHVFSKRLAQLCSAASLQNVPPELLGETTSFWDSIRARSEWVSLAISELQCCDDAHTQFLDVGRLSTSDFVTRTTSRLKDLIDDLLIDEVNEQVRTVTSDRFGVRVGLANGAVVVHNTVEFLVIFPTSAKILRPDELGPERWTEGTAFRIRRLRNHSELTVDQAVQEFRGLLTRFGEATELVETEIQGLAAIQMLLAPLGNGWEGSVLVFVFEEFTYIVESMCQEGETDQCDSVRDVIASIELLP